MTVLTLSEPCTRHIRKLIDGVVRSLPSLGRLRFGPWASMTVPWTAEAWTPGPDLLMGDPWLSRLVGRAVDVAAGVDIDSSGLREWLLIAGPGDVPLMRCELLRESDFCAWDALIESLPLVPARRSVETRRVPSEDGCVAVRRAVVRPRTSSFGRVLANVTEAGTELRCLMEHSVE